MMSDGKSAHDGVTGEVTALYEEYPYPGHGVVSAVVAKMLEMPLRRLQRQSGKGRLRVLDAGCGTGEQTLGVARAFPEVEVVGIDLNRASLDMAVRLADRTQISADFHRRNLMEPLDDLGTFDVIVSVGVLHSLADPRTGFAHLRRLAASQSTFMGMVYGAYGKWESILIRDTLRELCGTDATRSEQLEILASSRLANNTNPLHYFDTVVRRFRFGPRIPLLEAARRVFSGRNSAYQADMFTHVQEVTYSYQELALLLNDTGWRFEGWPRRSGMPDAPEKILRGRGLELARKKPLLEQAAIYEKLVRPMNLYFIASPRLDVDGAVR